jgi:hypothetical protein
MAERLGVSTTKIAAWASVVAFVTVPACTRPSGTPASIEAGPEASAPSPLALPTSSVPSPPLDQRIPAPAGEAKRTTIARLADDPELAPFVGRLEQHFGADSAGGFVVQRVDAAWGRTAILVSRMVADDDDADPLVLLIDHGEIVWLRDHPIAGIVGPVRELTLAAHPSGGTVLVAFVPTVSLVAARVWDEDGFPFAELTLFPIDVCESLSVTYAPGVGWLVAAARQGGARAQWLREDGMPAWGTNGLEVGSPWRAAAPITALFDTGSTVMLFQRGWPHVKRGLVAPDHLLASRYDESGKSLWTPLFDLGVVPNVANPSERVTVALVRPGVAHAGDIDLDASGPIAHKRR